MPFKTDNKDKQLLRVLILASSLIPIYVIYMAIFPMAIQVSIFTSIYSCMIIAIWVLYYFDFFSREQTIAKTNGNLKLNNNDESLS